ncbi:methylated-DNA--[protein]-cysteine S-methyltransferase [Anaeromicropila populeti]|uniref:Methylated-DNA--protein-cysteine methyltransferase n=1 Tax=Anaeromicropila populeti TaxID=37658 RepID=A0A1I6KLK6_9FIRM|nr:methylated-DNA--[protein]-cysteine S-methyltransferase [Anaeromicropila populeti]SFR92097.1 methylated-DNA-[protein]-cysteine S-methyltransferase [Anaeromicropila populeti]
MNDNTHFAIYLSKLGKIKINYNETAVTAINLVTDAVEIKEANHSALSEQAFQQLSEYLEGKRKTFDFPYELNGTEFQKKVWKALLDIPYGETRSYQDIAAKIGNPKGARAVGGANNKNPLLIVVPCHRVIGSSGKLTGYVLGLDQKEYLINLEKTNQPMTNIIHEPMYIPIHKSSAEHSS